MNKNRKMFYLGKSLQAAALAVVGLSLVVGIRENEIKKELTMLAFGIIIFFLGKLAESRG